MLFLLTAPFAQSAIKGAPFLPEEDARFDALEGNSLVNSQDGSHVKQLVVATYDFSKYGGSSTVNSGVIPIPNAKLPANALIVRSYLWIEKKLVGAGNTIAFSCQNANNIFTATNITPNAANSPVDGVETGASAVFANITAPCTVKATLAGNNLTAGKVTAYIEYVVHP